MLAPIVALQTFADRVRGADVILLIDSEAVEGALIKGYSCREDICLLISIFWDLALSLRARIFIDRISTDANPADWPSRNLMDKGTIVLGGLVRWYLWWAWVALFNFVILPCFMSLAVQS